MVSLILRHGAGAEALAWSVLFGLTPFSAVFYPVSVLPKAVQPDMLAVHGYKWLLCPNGAGFMYVRPALRERLPPNIVGWRSHFDWRSVDNLHHGVPEPTSRAEKYEGGMLPFALIYAMQASIEMMLEIGPDAIERRVLELAHQTREILRENGESSEKRGVQHCAAEGQGNHGLARSAWR